MGNKQSKQAQLLKQKKLQWDKIKQEIPNYEQKMIKIAQQIDRGIVDVEPIEIKYDYASRRALPKSIQFHKFTNPIMINQIEFILIPKNKYNLIFIHNINKCEWRKVSMNYEVDSHINSSTYCKKTNTLYLYHSKHKLYQINMKTNKYNILQPKNDEINIGSNVKCIMINGELHIIDGISHYIWNLVDHRFTKLFDLSMHNICRYYYEIIYVESMGILLLFGDNKTIYKYSVHKSLWTKMNVLMPKELDRFGISLYKNDKYVIIIGETRGTQGLGNEVYALTFDLETSTFKSSIREKLLLSAIDYKDIAWQTLDHMVEYKCIVSSNCIEPLLLIHGMIHNLQSEFGLKHIPKEIISLIHSMCPTEYIHVIQNGVMSNIKKPVYLSMSMFIDERQHKYINILARHWKINIDRLGHHYYHNLNI